MIYAIKFKELCEIEPSFKKYEGVKVAESHLELFADMFSWCDKNGYTFIQYPDGKAISSVDGQAIFLIEK